MEQTAVYDNEVVLNTQLAEQFLTTLADVCVRDYNRTYGFSDKVQALDLDAYETAQSGPNDKTMDVAIGIADHIDNRNAHPRLLLVELRLDYGGQGQNARTSQMKQKESHSRDILREYNLDTRSFFLFDEKVAAPRRSIHAREKLTDSSIRQWEILTPKQFLEIFKFAEELPYQPITNIKQVLSDAKSLIANLDYDNVIKLIRHWLCMEQNYFVKYNLNECSLLLKMIGDMLNALRPLVRQFKSQDTELEFMICDEEYDKATKQLVSMKRY